ncbi:MAG: Biopolymer transport protein ExbB [Planctomycetes bacterium ADurb.Bin126]|nr:MAG: Biopolymer transport protein ExbB [Planctomycetes bacterium ADurb.Bin126]
MLGSIVDASIFEIFIVYGGVVGYIIVALSVVMVALIIQYFIQYRRTTIVPDTVREQIQAMFENKQYREAIDFTAADASFLSGTVNAALAEAGHGYPAMERALEEAAEERTTKMLRHVEWLNLLGNIGPMLGLLGTVQGMILAFIEIAKTGTPKPADLAESIGMALVTTMQGLIVAIPSLSFYSIIRSRIDSLTSSAMLTAQELISNFRPGGKGGL